MDRKSIIVLILSFALILIWPKLMHELYPPPPKSTNTVATATNQLSTNVATTLSTNAIVAATNALPVPKIADNAPEQILVVTNADAIYSFTSRGGGLKTVQLRNYPAAIDCGKTTPAESRLATLNAHAPIPTLAWLDGNSDETGSFHLSQSNGTIRAEKTLTNGLVVIKEFQVSSNYLLHANVRVENRSAETATIPAREVVVGTATPMNNIEDESVNMGLFWYNGSKAEHVQPSWFANRSILSCVGMGGAPRSEYQNGASNVFWAAVHNQFFALAVIPREPAPKLVSRQIPLPDFTNTVTVTNGKAPFHPTGLQTAFAYPASALAAGQAIERQFTIYAGPKEYNALARIGDAMKNNLDAIMNFGFFGFFAKMLLLSMNGLHAMGLTYGLAIIAITVIIKLVFWPLTKASTKSMKRMQALQPQMKAIADKYKDDPMKKNQKTMEFMKEHKVSPLGGCLPMVLQIPVFFGFYTMIRSAIELRGASFLWACDLSQADTVAHIAGFPINVLPLIYGVTLLWSAQITPVSPGVDPAQQKMMKYMPVMFLLFLYKMAAGLTLYWTVQNLLTIAQLKLTKTNDEPKTAPVVVPKKKKR